MPVDILILTGIFLLGITFGSVLNLVICWIPGKEKSIEALHLHCVSCGNAINWRANLPVRPKVVRKGRCMCGESYTMLFPIVELLNGVCYVIIFMANGYNLQSGIYALMTSVLIVLSVVDEQTYEIPIECNYCLAGMGILLCCVEFFAKQPYDYHVFINHGIGFLCVSLFTYLLFRVSGGRAIGGGDVKLMATAGLILGWKNIIIAFFVGCILASVIHICRMKFSNKEHMLAMGPYLSMGIFIAALWGESFLQWYFTAF